MTTLQIKLAILSMIAENTDDAYKMSLAKEMYDWVMLEADVEKKEGSVIQLHTVQ